MYDELDNCETRLLVSGTFGQYVPQRFVSLYNAEVWGVSAAAIQVLLAGPEHEMYWEVWADEVLNFAQSTDEDGTTWFLAQTPEGDVFACRRLAAMSPEQYASEGGARCPICRSQDIEGGSVDILAGAACQEIGCNNCDATWVDIYRLVNYEELDTHNNEGT